MTARKLTPDNCWDLSSALRYALHGEAIHAKATALNPNEYAGYTAASMIPGLNDTDREIIYEAVNEAVEKASQGDPDPEDVMLFEIPNDAGTPLLALIELDGYVPTNQARGRGYWTIARTWLVKQKTFPKE